VGSKISLPRLQLPPTCPYTEHLLIMFVKFVSYGLDGPGFEFWKGQEISSYPKKSQTGSGAHPASYSMSTRCLAGDKDRAWCWTFPPRSAGLKNEWSYTATPPICLHGVDKDNFTVCSFVKKTVVFSLTSFNRVFMSKVQVGLELSTNQISHA